LAFVPARPIQYAAVLAATAALTPAAAPAVTIQADGCGNTDAPTRVYGTIGEALTLASPGDTVLVAPCVYHESIELPPGVVLRSSEGPFRTALLPAGEHDAIVAIGRDLDRDAVLEGFTIARSRHFALASSSAT